MTSRTSILIKSITAVVMIAALLLLVSGNYWAYGFKKQKQQSSTSPAAGDDEETGNAPAVPNPTEEKTAAGLLNIAEYLHNHCYTIEHPVATVHTGYPDGFERLPVHHPELLTPPPKRC